MDNCLSESEKKAFKEFQEETSRLPEDVLDDKTVEDKEILRFLAARKFDVPRAIELYLSHQNVRKKEDLTEINSWEESVRKELISGKLTVFSERDDEGASILLFTARLHFPNSTTHQAVLKGLVFQLDCALESLEAQRNGIVFIYDMTDSRFLNFDYDLSIKILNMLKGSYPARLKKVLIVMAPLWFKAPFKVLRLFILEKLRDRVHVIHPRDLLSHLPTSSIPTHMGGTLHLDHRTWLTKCLLMSRHHHQPHYHLRNSSYQKHYGGGGDDTQNTINNSTTLADPPSQQELDSYFQGMPKDFSSNPIPEANGNLVTVSTDEGFVGDDPKAPAAFSSISSSSCQKTSADSFLDTDDAEEDDCVGDDDDDDDDDDDMYQDGDKQRVVVLNSLDKKSNSSQNNSFIGRKRTAGSSDLSNPSKRRPSSGEGSGTCPDFVANEGSNEIDSYATSQFNTSSNHLSMEEGARTGNSEQCPFSISEIDGTSNQALTAPELLEHCKALGQKGLEKEYLALRSEPVNGSFYISKLKVNQQKNRYSDVLCLDETRVRLQTPSGNDNDYVNANFVDGYKKKKAYISTQGPLPKTFSDFWQMVWEQNIHIIVMTTKTIEKGRVKCDHYWPSEVNTMERHSNLAVLNTGATEESDSIISTLIIQNLGTSEEREVKHVHYLGWPDYGTPESPNSFLDFLEFVRDLQQKQRSTFTEGRNTEHQSNECNTLVKADLPLLVHCSAGIGRTGTFIAIDILTRALRDTCRTDVIGTVRKLRNQRALSIQMPDQYIFCYEALLCYAKRINLLEVDDDSDDDDDDDDDDDE